MLMSSSNNPSVVRVLRRLSTVLCVTELNTHESRCQNPPQLNQPDFGLTAVFSTALTFYYCETACCRDYC